ncbi:multidrug ABC transporter permease/ATP-binding protein [Carnobacterium maltaromaticum]|uniref:ABC transporter ATP-binding protein n=1 Tax=Carnobacterium maltaromaticum TaxID=2751 RepID=UPI000C782FA3|nr:ABC transporter transmembrane domain-containing protein [Carnobacterium maltaromaticum]PLS34627.1 multidrug ABC transporter permease/ATP-binding protein [Carnobacterium maltaromaticum]PLS36445.1 multidrug ABC transporter permease/ATP-binding protein [Carnobacterium maltaromaticum]PLS37260.1 multidrug ABC transporter permease/ATP-binding protein [Carnobacterium maltaromaticum]PLS43476.1 multidrug ABC transporter permease/ATP-binding protein [Carnobacterium maltaromaticum]PLS43821.1 multidrug
MGIFKKLGWFFKQEKKSYITGIFFLILVALVQLVPPRVIGVVVDEIAAGKMTGASLSRWLLILVAAGIGQYTFRYIWRLNIWGGAAKLEQTLRNNLFKHFTQMDHSFFQKYRTGDLMAHATNDLSAIQMVAGGGILTLADSMITGGATIIAMAIFIDWRLTLIALIPLPLLAVASRVLGSKLHERFRGAQAAFSSMNDKTQESISGIKVIKTFGEEAADVADFKEQTDKVVAKNKRVYLIDSLFDPAITFIMGISYVLTIIIGGSYVMSGTISIGQLISFISYIAMLIWPMFAIGRLFNILERGSASYNRVEELLSESSSIIENPNAVQELVNGRLDYRIDEFHYSEDDRVALNHVHFTIKQGDTLGIVGKTGAGKTTLFKLLLREYDEYAGSIRFGGHDIRDYSLNALLHGIGYVPQDQFLFSTTIRENIRFANPNLTDEDVINAAKLTAIHDDILGLPNGYDTLVGERGVSLSGGQKQRISIARALITNPELLILDDALSAVDAKTEEAILSALKSQRRDQTTIIAAHRISSVMHAEEIIVLDDAEIIERGNHQELIEIDGWYQDMFDRQQLEDKLEGGAN